MALLFAILVTVTLSSPFGDAEARALGAPSARSIDVTVVVEGTPAAVFASVVDVEGVEISTVALVPRGGGVYGQAIRLPAWEDVQISFEYVGADGESAVSSASSLSALGVDPDLMAPTVPEPPTPQEASGVSPWLFAGIAAGLIAIVVVLFWASGNLADSLKPEDWTFAPIDDGEPTEPSETSTS